MNFIDYWNIITITKKPFLSLLPFKAFTPQSTILKGSRYKKCKVSSLSRGELDSFLGNNVRRWISGESSPWFILRKRVGPKRNVVRWIELFHPIVVVFPNGRIGSHRWQQRRTMMRRRGRGKRTRNKRRTTRQSIPPATAYAFIIIHEILRRRFCELPSALRTGLKRPIREREGRQEGAGGEFLFRRENISSKQKQNKLPAVWAKAESEADEGKGWGEDKEDERRGRGRRPGSTR